MKIASQWVKYLPLSSLAVSSFLFMYHRSLLFSLPHSTSMLSFSGTGVL